MQNSPETDLDWLAFRYISGEMAVSEADQFESLLADDQHARDAVVRAVELSQTVLAAGFSRAGSAPQSPSIGLLPAVSNAWMQHLAWISTSVAALVLVALALNVKGPSAAAISAPNDLASAWLARSTEHVDAETTSNGGAGDAEEFVTAAPPAWMLEAVRSLQDEDSPKGDDANDNEMES